MRLGTKTKQPGERRPYTINYGDALVEGDSIDTVTLKTPPPPELIVDQITVMSPRVRFFVDRGTDATTYKLTFVATTHDGVRFEDEVIIKVKEQ